MSKLVFKVNFLGSQTEEGSADRLVFTDQSSVLTIQSGHAPLISLLNDGKLVVSDGDVKKEYPYKSGLLRVNGGLCTVTVLR